MSEQGKTDRQVKNPADPEVDITLPGAQLKRNHYSLLIPETTLMAHAWLFRFALTAVASLTVLFCHWLFNSTSPPIVEALLPAIGLTIGFGLVGARNLVK